MIFFSILAKTFALALGFLHPWLGLGCWMAGAAADLWAARQATDSDGLKALLRRLALWCLLAVALAGLGLVRHHPWWALGLWLAGVAVDLLMNWSAEGARGLKCVLGRFARWQVAALVIGLAAGWACDYGAMRWKDGIPVFASMVSGGLGLLGVAVGSQGGLVCLTTMAGPLEFAASINGMALQVPVILAALCAVWFGCAETSLAESLRKLGWIAGLLLLLALVRLGCVVMLANALFDFVGFETEELPYRPFMDETAAVWAYLPLLAAVAVLFGRWLAVAPAAATAPVPVPRWLRWAAVSVLLALAAAIAWEPAGSPKSGRVVISTYHSQWSSCKRPYDREWYGADSGYNYACLKRLFEEFYQVAEAPGEITAKDLDGASTLVIYDPDRQFTPDELKRVREFVHQGGGLFLIGDHTNVFGSASNLNELCEPFGFQYRDDVLFDLDEDFHQVIDPPSQPSSLWHGLTFFKLRGPTSIRPTSLWTRPVYEVGHAKGVRAIYSVNNFYPPPHDDPKMKSGKFCVSASAHYGRGRVVAWGDSTVFSNFEIFYPGKYEYLLNTMQWLGRKDGLPVSVVRTVALLLLFAGVAALLLWRRDPRLWLATALALVGALGAVRLASGMAERARAEFPKPIRPSEWVVFGATAADKAHHLRGFITEEPYDQRYEVFIQWVLRTGAYSGFQLLDAKSDNGLYDHLRTSDNATTALALIVRKPEDLAQLDDLAKVPAGDKHPLLLMFSSSIPVEDALARIQVSGLVKSADEIVKIAAAWPQGEVEIQDGGRRVLVVAGAERFSDQAMGISEKVTPDATQRATFGQAFGIIDRLFGRTAPAAK
ncbi:MAG: hypothetical protein RLZZ522_578 [Verrucomicrobiota bacterium]